METYSSLNCSASTKAPSRTLFAAWLICCCTAPVTFGMRPSRVFDFTRESLRTHTQPREQRRDDAVLLRDERAQKVQRLDLLMIVARRNVLRRLHGFLSFQCEFVEANHWFVPPVPRKSAGPVFLTGPCDCHEHAIPRRRQLTSRCSRR